MFDKLIIELSISKNYLEFLIEDPIAYQELVDEGISDLILTRLQKILSEVKLLINEGSYIYA